MDSRDVARMLGAALMAFRQQRGLRQDDVARAAHRAGLDWTRSVVAALETGRRYLTVDEFARLPFLLEGLGVPRGEASVQLTNLGDMAQLQIPALLDPKGRGLLLERRGAARDAAEQRLRIALGRRAVPAAKALEIEHAAQLAGGELEQRLGRRYRIPAWIVALVAWRTWKRSATEERDRQLASEVTSDMVPSAARALRGHITRQLLETLGPQLTEARQRLRKKGGPR